MTQAAGLSGLPRALIEVAVRKNTGMSPAVKCYHILIRVLNILFHGPTWPFIQEHWGWMIGEPQRHRLGWTCDNYKCVLDYPTADMISMLAGQRPESVKILLPSKPTSFI